MADSNLKMPLPEAPEQGQQPEKTPEILNPETEVEAGTQIETILPKTEAKESLAESLSEPAKSLFPGKKEAESAPEKPGRDEREKKVVNNLLEKLKQQGEANFDDFFDRTYKAMLKKSYSPENLKNYQFKAKEIREKYSLKQ